MEKNALQKRSEPTGVWRIKLIKYVSRFKTCHARCLLLTTIPVILLKFILGALRIEATRGLSIGTAQWEGLLSVAMSSHT